MLSNLEAVNQASRDSGLCSNRRKEKETIKIWHMKASNEYKIDMKGMLQVIANRIDIIAGIIFLFFFFLNNHCRKFATLYVNSNNRMQNFS